MGRVASVAAQAVFYGSLACLAAWLLWYGQHQWAGYDCKVFRKARPGGAPAAWVVSTPCALKWSRPLLQANVGFLFLTPAVAALAAIAVMGLRQHKRPSASSCSRVQEAAATVRSWGSTLLPPKRFWLWWCNGLTVTDALVLAAWAAYNAVWYSTILGKALSKLPPGMQPSPRLFAKSFASLMSPNLIPLLFPVSRGSVISNVLGLSYPEGIRYHRWLGQWVLMLVSLHGLIYWISWAADGRWVAAALRGGQDTNYLLGGVALLCALLLWATSQEPVRRWSFRFYKAAHFLGFWGFLILGVAHHWSLVWYFVPGLLLYAVDGVFRLHQMFAGRSGRLAATGSTAAAAGAASAGPCAGVNVEVLRADVDPAGTMCSLLLSAPEFGAAPAGIVWLNVPCVSLNEWHPFDYTASEVAVVDGRACNALTSGKGVAEGRRATAMSVHIKAYSRWTKTLVSRVSQGDEHLTVRVQGPYADPPAHVGQPDGVVLVAGGNGIASALPVFEELSAAGVSTQGLPALLLWACRKGYEFEHMAAPVLAAAHALGLSLTVQLHITDGADMSHVKGSAAAKPASPRDVTPQTDHSSSSPGRPPPHTTTLAAASTASSSEAGSDVGVVHITPPAASKDARAAAASEGAVAGPTGLCPVVAFASFAAQLSFKAVLHLMVFAGFLLGLFIATYVGGTRRVAAGQQPWETAHLGPAMVLLPAGFSLVLGLITLWTGLFLQRTKQRMDLGLPPGRGPAAAIAAFSGRPSRLTHCSAAKQAAPVGEAAAAFMLEVPAGVSGAAEALPVVAQRPAVSTAMQAWLRTLQQLPAADTAQAGSGAGRVNVVVYGCGPVTLDHATQLAVASCSAKLRRRGGRQVQLQFVRKAQML